ncbi:MAG: stage II sporulation protein P [Caldicoprobacterales bacterium]|nr:stage II sporulation protein P [Clostridiales bacterium]
MERIRINKRSNLTYNLVVILLIVGIVFFSYRLLSNHLALSNSNSFSESENVQEEGQIGISGSKGDFFSDIWIRLKEINLTDPAFILSSHMPYLSAPYTQYEPVDTEDESVVAATVTAEQDISRQAQRPSSDDLERYEEAVGEVSEEIQIQVKKISDDLPPITLQGSGPQILIYHTHSREAYRQDPDNPYKDIAVFRSNDLSQTVVGVGEELAKELQKRNIPVLHDRTDHEVYPWKSGLYPRSLDTIRKRQKEHKSLKIFLDIHRNYNEKLKDPDKEVVIINGERVAKFFILIGTAQGVSGGFSEKPNWRENYQFALKITNLANEKYPGLADKVMLKTGRYNQHVSNRAILIEIGNHMTTFAEAKRSARYIAEILSDIIEK